MKIRVVSFEDLRGQLNGFGSPFDGFYALPMRSWVADQFSVALKLNIFSLGLRFSSEDWDCDDYAKYAWGLASICHGRTLDHPKSAIAFGVYIYYVIPTDPRSCHAINFFFDENLKLTFYEPQNQTIITLTNEQVNSCQKWLL
jgi:hypothetical protein